MEIDEPSVGERYQFALYLLSAYRDCKTLFPGGYTTFIVATCAATGNRHTGKAMNVSTIARMTGISRPTVIRKISLLEEIGMVTTIRSEKETKVMMTEKSWKHVRSHVTKLMELESYLSNGDRNSMETI